MTPPHPSTPPAYRRPSTGGPWCSPMPSSPCSGRPSAAVFHAGTPQGWASPHRPRTRARALPSPPRVSRLAGAAPTPACAGRQPRQRVWNIWLGNVRGRAPHRHALSPSPHLRLPWQREGKRGRRTLHLRELLARQRIANRAKRELNNYGTNTVATIILAPDLMFGSEEIRSTGWAICPPGAPPAQPARFSGSLDAVAAL